MASLKLTLLRVESFKRVDEAVIGLDPAASGVVALMGPNESGKTSTLDAFETLVAGRAIPKRSKPVKTGAGKAVIVGEFTEEDGSVLRVTRTYTDGGGTNIVVHQDGIRVAKPDEILRRLYSHIALDPLAFANSPSKAQADTLIRLIGFDPAPIDKRHDDAYATRTEVNRDVKRLETEVRAYPDENPTLAAADLVSVVDLSRELDQLLGRNRDRETADSDVIVFGQSITDLERQIAQLEGRLAATRGAQKRAAETRVALGEIEESGPIRDRIATAESTNDAIRAQRARAAKAKELAEARDRVTNLEGIMAESVDAKAAAFAEADWPVPGLEIREGEVYLDGTPFAETSAGRKLRTSTAIAIRMNPDLKAIVIRDGSLLDADNRVTIDEIAREHGFTVLMEIVGTDAETGVVFSEGTIVDRKGAVS